MQYNREGGVIYLVYADEAVKNFFQKRKDLFFVCVGLSIATCTLALIFRNQAR